MRKHFLLLLLAAVSSSLAAETDRRPNIVLVMTDDQGWGDAGYNGHPDLKTPNLDEMAKSGLRLNRFYAAHFNCSPTRGSVLTGRHPNRFGCFSHGYPIRAGEYTVAQLVKSSGYATGHFGKWHLNGVKGPGQPVLTEDPLNPGRMGFDEWVSASNYYDLNPTLARNGVAEPFTGDSSDIATDEALKFIRKQKEQSKPFLAVIWFGSPHNPHRALDKDKALYRHLPEKEQDYYGELTAVDRSVGRLRSELRALTLADDTILWFCSDNGGHFGPKSTGDLRGSKGTLWEGGVRVPGIVEWPSRIREPFSSDIPCSTMDIFPTIAAALNTTPADPSRPIDGISLLPVFQQQITARSKPLPFWNHEGEQPAHAALLDWPYKLHLNPVAIRVGKGTDRPSLPTVLLYDVSKDPKETTDLAAQDPERVSKMTATLEAWKASVDKSLAGEDYRQTGK